MKLADGGGGAKHPFLPNPTATAIPILRPTITSIVYPKPTTTPINGKSNLFPFILILIALILIIGWFLGKFLHHSRLTGFFKKRGKLL